MVTIKSNIIDYKKESKNLYMPKAAPMLIDVPTMNFVAVRGKGNPNVPDGEFQRAVGVLYAIQYTIKMSKMSGAPQGYFDYVVPPLEGFWWLDSEDFAPALLDKDKFVFIVMIRLPEFVTKEVFDWAKNEAANKKKLDVSMAEFLTLTEGLCVQSLHTGSYDAEPATIAKIEEYVTQSGFENDIGKFRHHHEIYLSDPRKCEPSKMKTVLRIPVRRSKDDR